MSVKGLEARTQRKLLHPDGGAGQQHNLSGNGTYFNYNGVQPRK